MASKPPAARRAARPSRRMEQMNAPTGPFAQVQGDDETTSRAPGGAADAGPPGPEGGTPWVFRDYASL